MKTRFNHGNQLIFQSCVLTNIMNTSMETKLNSNIFLLKNKIVKLKIQEKLMARIEVEDVSYLNEQVVPKYAKDSSLNG